MKKFLEINLENLSQNIRNLKGLLKPETKFMAVVKSNAYGHGLVDVSKAASSSGADWFGVINVAEGMQLRQAGIAKPVLVLAAVNLQEARQAANQGISIPIISLNQAREIAEIGFDKPLKVHLKVDTGLNRLGMEKGEVIEAAKILSSNQNIVLEGVYSHLAAVEENNFEFTSLQITEFEIAIKLLTNAGFDHLIKHIAATSAVIILPDSGFDMVRCGIGIYGLWPSEEIKATFNRPDFLRPVLTYMTELVQVKEIKIGEKIGYGCSFEAKEDMEIGILPIGYYEGLDRGLSNIGEVLVKSKRCPIVGRVAMNMCVVDITGIDAEVGDRVTIIGCDDSEEITADEIAKKINTINYEVVTRIPEHIEREYI